MKRIICLVLCGLLLLGIILMPIVAAEVNMCSALEDKACELMFYGVEHVEPGESFPISEVMHFAYWRVDGLDQYADQTRTEGGETWVVTHSIPADVFEATAAKYFAVVDIEAMRNATGEYYDMENEQWITDFRYYHPDRNVYIMPNPGGAGDAAHYAAIGYEKTDYGFTGYFQCETMYWGEGKPEGVEGEDYILLDGAYWEIAHYLQASFTYDGTDLRYYSWIISEDKPTAEGLITPDTEFPPENVFTGEVELEDLKVKADPEIFPENTVVQIRHVSQESDPDAYTAVEQALEAYNSFVAYDVSAVCKDAPVQPDGKVELSFQIPDTFDPGRIAVLYVDDNGKVEELESTVEDGFVCILTDHFSYYVLAEKAESVAPSTGPQEGTTAAPDSTAAPMDGTIAPTDGDQPSGDPQPDSGWIWIVLAAVALLAGAAVCVFVIRKNKKA